MDLHIHGPEATQAERAAVDSVVGASSERPGPRDLLLPALHAVQARFGWLPQGALNYICKQLHIPPAEAYGVATFYHLLSVKPQPPTVVHVCDDIACRINGGEFICRDLEQRAPTGTWKRSPCLGQCERAPAALVVRSGESPCSYVLPKTASAAIAANLDAGPVNEQDSLESLRWSVPQFGSPGLRLIRRIGQVDPE